MEAGEHEKPQTGLRGVVGNPRIPYRARDTGIRGDFPNMKLIPGDRRGPHSPSLRESSEM
jgi:hypothetical protein